MASKQTRGTRASRIGGAFLGVLHKHTKTRKPEGRLCMERRGRRSREEKGALVIQKLNPARPGQGRGSRVRACSPASPGRWAEQSCARRSSRPVTCLCRLTRSPAPPPVRGVSRSRVRARSPIRVWRWEKRNCAGQFYRPIARLFRLPCGPAPGAGALTAAAARVFCAVGITEGGSVPVGERLPGSWIASGSAAQSNRAPFLRLGDFSTAPQA